MIYITKKKGGKRGIIAVIGVHILRASLIRDLDKDFGCACNLFELSSAEQLSDLVLDFTPEVHSRVCGPFRQEDLVQLLARRIVQLA